MYLSIIEAHRRALARRATHHSRLLRNRTRDLSEEEEEEEARLVERRIELIDLRTYASDHVAFLRNAWRACK